MKSVKEFKFKDLILHNFALKILAVVLAVIIWVAIVNIDNPSRTTMISGIQVVFLNEDALGQKGYTYSVQSGSVISISVKAPQSIAESLEASDFYAYADFIEHSRIRHGPSSTACGRRITFLIMEGHFQISETNIGGFN